MASVRKLKIMTSRNYETTDASRISWTQGKLPGGKHILSTVESSIWSKNFWCYLGLQVCNDLNVESD